MTDARFGRDLLPAIRRLPAGSGVIFRHYHLAPDERRALFGAVRRICRRRGHMLVIAGTEIMALRWRADGFHSRSGQSRSHLPRTAPVHDRAELREAQRNRVGLVLISPLFSTDSHPDKRPLGRLAFNSMAKQSKAALVVALGGMDRRRAQTLNRTVIYGWAAIDTFRKNRD